MIRQLVCALVIIAAAPAFAEDKAKDFTVIPTQQTVLCYRFEPKRDITAYELAIISKHLGGLAYPTGVVVIGVKTPDIKELPPRERRHFVLAKPEECTRS